MMYQTNEELVEFANKLKMLREESGLSLRALAEELNISKSALQQYESAISDPSMTVVRRIADYFDEDANWLVGITKVRTKGGNIKKMA